jgi:hypothetical protein
MVVNDNRLVVGFFFLVHHGVNNLNGPPVGCLVTNDDDVADATREKRGPRRISTKKGLGSRPELRWLLVRGEERSW